jgi:tetratricopeptide (TPR) repeat protein
MLAMDEFVTTEAEFYFRQAIQIKEDFRSALFNLALLLSDAGRPLESIHFLNELIKFHPDHVKGLILLGDIHINTLKDLDVAETCYRRILSIDPDNVQAVHNMGVISYQKG